MSIAKIVSKLTGRKSPRCVAVIVAAGSASRMQGVNKILVELDGESVISRTISVFQQCPGVHQIVVVTREDMIGYITSLCAAKEFNKVTDVVLGGETRVDSVMAGLGFAKKDMTLAAIHDGARPLVTVEQVEQVIAKAAKTGAAAPAIPVKDTIKVAERGVVTGTPDRSTLFAVQTPQVFDIDLLRGALQRAGELGASITDDCSAVELLGMKVHLTEGSEENRKITTPLDLLVAEAILKRRRTI